VISRGKTGLGRSIWRMGDLPEAATGLSSVHERCIRLDERPKRMRLFIRYRSCPSRFVFSFSKFYFSKFVLFILEFRFAFAQRAHDASHMALLPQTRHFQGYPVARAAKGAAYVAVHAALTGSIIGNYANTPSDTRSGNFIRIFC
jgi:hypothetical protein